MNLLIVGPQASGKGTQAEKLVDKFNLAHIEMGGLLRNMAKEDSSFGKQVAELINSGQLVPDEMIIEVINKYLANIGKLDGILFDGFPRIVSQAEYFDNFLSQKGQKLDLVVYLTLPREEVFKRLINRRICSQCGKVFNILTNPPKVEGICDFCGGALVIREDDTPEKINKRLDGFENKTVPMIEYYKQKGIVEKLDGNRPIEVIFDDVVERMKKRGLL
ncbi:adenylate kinase [Candidatus Shapirobacteria bacterium CG03_land_8_20_14_0_80_40_19]|uniref:Adenylate kinase n=3 Tax=Candidatus Shapironibacteriota TaxID=1752721 RepID=A0A2M7BE18_9BACT|nr:MAG: adenylate kinase [Candidatus Shapirobacteria bacterium CG03_land_8_20_14_0_80_40_19]PJC29209.1 MAG: adenylate kinase [Candidatus Shapirobacteria bacterium CG_4_9_14_0_2_um_filter_40_11]PJC76668.1 MAG: adenylate kinase [Candidatus Shapirobacteria bacterium CG_4_8_14_3_um_filter_39_11]